MKPNYSSVCEGAATRSHTPARHAGRQSHTEHDVIPRSRLGKNVPAIREQIDMAVVQHFAGASAEPEPQAAPQVASAATDVRAEVLMQYTGRDSSEDQRQRSHAELIARGYFDGRMTKSRLIQGELFSEEEIR
jgi:hypothetical protein